MKNYVKIALMFFGACCVGSQHTIAQDSLTTPYLPYQPGDVLVYYVTQSSERQDDSKMTIVGDSVGENGEQFFFIETKGSRSVASGFKVDTAGNIYASKWWSGSDYWKVFDSSKGLDEPWIALHWEENYELGKFIEVTSDEAFNVASEVKRVHIYLGFEDSLATSGYDRNITRWKSGIGITHKFNYEGGPTHTLKGAVIDGVVFGDTTVFQHPPPGEVQKDYFPYQVGDVLVYSVTDSIGKSHPDSRIEFVRDSVDSLGNTWFFIESEGYEPVVEQFMVDTAKNIYATGWWGGNEEPWKVFEAYFDSNPWIVLNKGDTYELGDIWGGHSSYWLFNEPQFSYNDIGLVVNVDYYEEEDSTLQSYLSKSQVKVMAKWNASFGIILKDDSLSNISYEIKGAYVNGELRGDTAAVITSSELKPIIPSGITLNQNYPNPFNPSTTISFELDQPAELSLTIYSVTGQVVQKLIQNERYAAGSHQVQFDAGNQGNISSGIYLYKLTTPSHRVVKKMTLIK